ncbi:MAG: DUF1326 domain-containing protein [Gammaproteobacteria bacterium]|nr:DUF1326 domain-containing protein [Gammaproteobacteria bacterium]
MASWNVQGTYVEACNCEAVCPCIFFSPPTEGSCTVMIGWHIDAGSFEDTSLDDLNAALLAHSPGNMKDGDWKVALYVDDRADEAQNQALMGIFSGQAGGHIANLGPLISEVLGARPAAISFNASDGGFSLSVEGLGHAEAKAIEGQGGGPVTVEGHPLAVSPGYAGRVARASRLELDDYGFALDMSAKAAMSAPFSYSS